MGLVIWRAARRYPQISAFGEVSSVGSFGSVAEPAQTGRMRRLFIRTQPVYKWDNNKSLIGGNKQWGGTITPVHATTGSGVRDHYDVGNETAFLTLLPEMAGLASSGSKFTSPALQPLPILSGSAVASRHGVGTFTLATVLDGEAHTETGGNKSASGTLNEPRVLTGSGTLQHLASGLILLAPVQTLSGSSLLYKTGVGALTLSPVLSGNPISTETGSLVARPTLSGKGEVRVRSGLWVVLPEDTRGWTVQ